MVAPAWWRRLVHGAVDTEQAVEHKIALLECDAETRLRELGSEAETLLHYAELSEMLIENTGLLNRLG